MFSSRLHFFKVKLSLKKQFQKLNSPRTAKSITKLLDELPSWDPRGQLGDLPSDLAPPGWLRVASCGSIWPRLARSGCPWRPCWFDLASTCSIWLPLVPWLARFGSFVRSWAPQLVRFGCQRLPYQHDYQKNSICSSTIQLRCCLLRALWNVSHASNLISKYLLNSDQKKTF